MNLRVMFLHTIFIVDSLCSPKEITEIYLSASVSERQFQINAGLKLQQTTV